MLVPIVTHSRCKLCCALNVKHTKGLYQDGYKKSNCLSILMLITLGCDFLVQPTFSSLGGSFSCLESAPEMSACRCPQQSGWWTSERTALTLRSINEVLQHGGPQTVISAKPISSVVDDNLIEVALWSPTLSESPTLSQ